MSRTTEITLTPADPIGTRSAPSSAASASTKAGGRVRDTAIREALQRAERVEATVTEVLTRSRDPLAPVEPIDVGAVMVAARTGRWGELARARRRTLDLVVEPGLPAAAATTAVLNQVLDVLVTNALDHGAGTVTVAARTA